MNYSATGFEWLMLPVLTVTQSDRLLFLANLVSYLLLPSLVFSVFIQLGVAAKAAWHWMWLLPCGYCFAMQAGSIGNDAFAAVYALAAIHYSLRAVRTRRVEDLWVTGLSIGLLTGAKASNIPLVLPALLLAAPAVRLLRTRMAGSLCMGFLVLVVSFAPIAALNKFFTGDWTGDPTADLQVRNPAIGLLGNTLQLVDQSLQPPVLPLGVRRAQDRLLNSLPANLRDALNRDFPRFALDIGELPQEESAGLGLGITLLAAVAVFAPLLERKPAYKSPLHWFTAHRTGLLVGAAAWLACLAYMCSFGSEATARLLSPYYPLLILPLVLHRANASIVQRRWWKTLAVVGAGSTLIGLILTPSRPLWPARPVIEAVMSAAPTNQQLARIDEVYKVYGDRHDLLAPLRAHIPVDVQTIGLVAGPNDSEIALWRPFGRRRVVELVEGDAQPLELVPQPKWVVVKEDALHSRGESLQSWLTRIGGSVVDQETITSIIEEGPMVWDLVRLGD